LLQDTFSIQGNAFNLKPVFESHASEIQANNAKPGTCSKDFLNNFMTIHFKREWLNTYVRDTKVNKIGERLGFTYGIGYWTRFARTQWLPGEEEMEKCKDFYEL